MNGGQTELIVATLIIRESGAREGCGIVMPAL